MAFDQAKACELIAGGESLRAVGKALGCAASTICEKAIDDPQFGERYARAMELRADHHASLIEDLAQKVEDGTLEPDRARVAIDARKWTAAKLRPKRYGDKLALEHDGKLEISIADPAKLLRK